MLTLQRLRALRRLTTARSGGCFGVGRPREKKQSPHFSLSLQSPPSSRAFLTLFCRGLLFMIPFTSVAFTLTRNDDEQMVMTVQTVRTYDNKTVLYCTVQNSTVPQRSCMIGDTAFDRSTKVSMQSKPSSQSQNDPFADARIEWPLLFLVIAS